jgi:transposase
VIEVGGEEPVMLIERTDAEWEIVVEAFRAARSRRGGRGRDDREFLEAPRYFTVHDITWRALPREFGKANRIWKQFWRPSQRGVFEAMLALLAETSRMARLVQMLDTTQMVDTTIARAHVSAAGAKGGGRARRSAVRAADFQPEFT